MSRTVLILLGATLLLSGCAHTVRVPLKPGYDTGLTQPNTLASVRPAVSLGPSRFADARADTSKLATFKQQAHTYNLYSERPLSQVFFDGLNALFTRSGHTWTSGDAASVRVDVHLLSVHAARNAGFVAVGAKSGVQIKLDFTDVRSSRVLYSQIYNGSDERSQALVGFMGMVNASLDQSILNCLNEVGKDEKLADALRSLIATQ